MNVIHFLQSLQSDGRVTTHHPTSSLTREEEFPSLFKRGVRGELKNMAIVQIMLLNK